MIQLMFRAPAMKIRVHKVTAAVELREFAAVTSALFALGFALIAFILNRNSSLKN